MMCSPQCYTARRSSLGTPWGAGQGEVGFSIAIKREGSPHPKRCHIVCCQRPVNETFPLLGTSLLLDHIIKVPQLSKFARVVCYIEGAVHCDHPWWLRPDLHVCESQHELLYHSSFVHQVRWRQKIEIRFDMFRRMTE